jgi:hypothetical protein
MPKETHRPSSDPRSAELRAGDAKDNDARAIRDRPHAAHSVESVCKDQEWRCAYPCAGNGEGGPLLPGEPVARAYDNHSICHLECAKIGTVPTKGNPFTINGALRGQTHG